MNRFWIIGNSKKVFFSRKIRFYFLIKLFLYKKIKTDFFQKSTFFESSITQKQFIFEHSHVSYGKRKKSCTLIVI